MLSRSVSRVILFFLFAVSIIMAPAVLAQDIELSILQWSHFVPRYDEWFDQYAQEWGAENGASVTVDHINLAELPATLAAEIDAGAGHSIIEMLFSPAAFIDGLHDLSDINRTAEELYGEPLQSCKANSYLPIIDQYYGLTHTYVPDPGDYIISLWTAVGYPDGPSTYDELLDGGRQIREQFGIPLGIGMSPELDSEMATRAIMWSFGASVQDENENVVLNSPETIAAVEYMVELYNAAMTDEIFSWNAASNNQGLIAGDLSYILNSISAFRSLQKIDEAAAGDIGFTPALAGPAGAFASSHLWSIYVIPKHIEGEELELAKKFILDHLANFNDAVYYSEMYNFPCYPSTAPDLDGWLENDPFGSVPPDKLKVLTGAQEWGVYLGYPGFANPAIGQVFNEFIISSMFARVALGEMTAEESVAQASQRVEEIFAEWRERGLVGGGDNM
jgi:multiple sugar transport system substrate-binding protein